MSSECRFPLISVCSHGCSEHNWSDAALCDVGAETLRSEIERYRVQLAGVSTAALGAILDDSTCKMDEYGWSVVYQDTLDLRRKYEALRREIALWKPLVVKLAQINVISGIHHLERATRQLADEAAMALAAAKEGKDG